MRFRKSELGQALAEYMPLIPPVLLLSVLILIPIAENSSDIFCRMVNALEPEKCVTDIMVEEDDECVILDQEEGSSQCAQEESCTELEGSNSGLYVDVYGEEIKTFVIKAGKEYHVFYSGPTDDGCYNVIIDKNAVTWNKLGSGSDCKDVSNSQVWKKSVCQ